MLPYNPYAGRLIPPLLLTVLLLLLTFRISNPARRYQIQIGILVCLLFVGLALVMKP